ncbi:hypothetical protein [Novosphingobium huizhouense]|uniref:hypothetical protein n=1 Tax=Novosphingobium huizhouense TaxID=2866625 RepID=UPI001CD912FC|nr:hypothetical protein [Novosphingobium huizhouense]
MKRSPPSNPALAESGLDRALDLLVAPQVPAGLAARIAHEAVRRPQVPGAAPAAPLAAQASLLSTSLPPAPLAATLPGRSPPAAANALRWRAGAGVAALAAGLALVVLVGLPRGEQDAATAPIAAIAGEVRSPAPAGADTAAPLAPVASGQPVALAAAAAQGTPAGSAAAARTVRGAATRDAAGPSAAAEPDTGDAPALAAAVPPGPSAAVAAPSAEDAAPVGPRGPMGPSLPQGFGYTGGIAGGLPAGAPVTMSGGPGMGGSGMGGSGVGPGAGPGGGAHPF